ncbi:hypothetical protein OG216_09485 [Streptomycetaceae bacterium NBC_01309]
MTDSRTGRSQQKSRDNSDRRDSRVKRDRRSQQRPRTGRGVKRNWPICPTTGKQRLGERKDAKLALAAARASRARAELMGLTSTWVVVRAYRCECGGWHLTSMAVYRGPR